MEFKLDCQTRPTGSKPNALRRQGKLPAVLYGHQGAESVAIVVDAKEAEMLVRRASLNNSLVQLDIPDLSWNGKALIREVQSHPWRGSLYHLSFFSVAAQDSLEVDVPIHLVGEASGVKNSGGSLDIELTELRVRCAPDRIPESIEIDVSGLELGESLLVNQIVLPEGVTSVGEPDRVVVIVLSPGGAKADADDEAGAAG